MTESAAALVLEAEVRFAAVLKDIYPELVDVAAAVAELGLAEEWIGKHNREVQTPPVLDLRESAMRPGLLRNGTLS